jgi:hypothetical protein
MFFDGYEGTNCNNYHPIVITTEKYIKDEVYRNLMNRPITLAIGLYLACIGLPRPASADVDVSISQKLKLTQEERKDLDATLERRLSRAIDFLTEESDFCYDPKKDIKIKVGYFSLPGTPPLPAA